MQSRNSSQWQSRRKPSLGKLRRAHPASGATWNVQVVRGKMTSKCLWHACRALAIGMVLMLLGAGMATVGYYADQLSIGQEIRGNATVRVKNESRGFHLNNLSYAGPIIMGFGGFIVVAACVMTFEARDSAAKVVPARFKMTSSSRSNIRSNNSSASSTRRANGTMHQSTRWDHHLGVFKTSPAEPPPAPIDRQALTAALIHFSKTLGNSPRQSPKGSHRLSRCGSVPNLTALSHRSSVVSTAQLSPSKRQLLLSDNISSNYQHQNYRHHHHHHHHHHQHHHGSHHNSRHNSHHNSIQLHDESGEVPIKGNGTTKNGRRLPKSRSSRISTSLIHRSSRESTNSLLHPGILYLQRHALSVDETGPYFQSSMGDSPQTSLSSVLVPADSHEGRLRDRTKRSDTAKRHILSRQKPIEKEEPQSPRYGYTEIERRRSSTTSDASYASRGYYRRASSTSRTPSIDSRSVQVELHSPDKCRTSPRTPQRFGSAQSSTPSVEREFRSQLSVCSEPMTMRQLSGQSSLEPCVLEESPESEDKDEVQEVNVLQSNSCKGGFILTANVAEKMTTECNEVMSKNGNSPISNTETPCKATEKRPRPESLILHGSVDNWKSIKAGEAKKLLQRSYSSRTFYRPKPKPVIDYDQIYFIGSSGRINDNREEDFYDSLQVINERRSKILKASESYNNSEVTQNSTQNNKEEQQQDRSNSKDDNVKNNNNSTNVNSNNNNNNINNEITTTNEIVLKKTHQECKSNKTELILTKSDTIIQRNQENYTEAEQGDNKKQSEVTRNDITSTPIVIEMEEVREENVSTDSASLSLKDMKSTENNENRNENETGKNSTISSDSIKITIEADIEKAPND